MRVAQIGLGAWGQDHAKILDRLGALAAVCDADPDRAREAGSVYGVNHYTATDRLLDSEELDAAIVCTPTATHAEVASGLIERKKHVLVAAPMTDGSEQARRLQRLAERNGTVLACGYPGRFGTAAGTIKEFIRSEKYGRLVMMDLHRDDARPPVGDDRVVDDAAVHDIDAAMWYFDETPEVVFARAGGSDEEYAAVMLGFAGERTAMVSASRIAPAGTYSLCALCTEGVIISDLLTEVKVKLEGRTERVRADAGEPLLGELRAFLDAAGGAEVPIAGAGHAVNVTLVAEAAQVSAQSGAPIYMDLK